MQFELDIVEMPENCSENEQFYQNEFFDDKNLEEQSAEEYSSEFEFSDEEKETEKCLDAKDMETDWISNAVKRLQNANPEPATNASVCTKGERTLTIEMHTEPDGTLLTFCLFVSFTAYIQAAISCRSFGEASAEESDSTKTET